MARQTYGITSTEVGYVYPDILVGSTNQVTDAGLTYMIGLAASEFSGICRRAGIDPATDIAADTDTDLYGNAQKWVLMLLGPMLQAAAHGQVATAEEMESVRIEVRDALAELRAKPQDLGEVPTNTTPRVATSTSALNLDTGSSARNKRRFFDDVRDRTSGDPDIYRN